jgi:hypothetical protein
MLQAQREDPNDPRVIVLRRFRNLAIFWIGILVAYFVGVGAFLDATHTPAASALPIFMLLFGCIVIGSVWHAAAIIALTASNLLDK